MRLLAACCCVAALALAAAEKPGPGQKLVELEFKLPKPAYIGTPKEIKNTSAQKVTDRRPAWKAPAGVSNAAYRRPVTSSTPSPIIGELKQITDGDKEGTEGAWVELDSGLQWVQVDLGRRHDIFGLLIWLNHGESRVYRDVVAQVSDDPDFIAGVKTVFNNDHDSSAGLGIGKDEEFYEYFEGKLIDLVKSPVVGRYVRIYSQGNTSNDQNHWTEIEVYGRAAN